MAVQRVPVGGAGELRIGKKRKNGDLPTYLRYCTKVRHRQLL